jgi:uncharacterized membrane protein YdjX (TVP38/TMEM64 family)
MLVPLAIVGVFVLVAWRLGYFNLQHSDRLQHVAQRAGGSPWLAVLFVLIYAVLATFAAPVSPLAYAAGALFDLTPGLLAVWIGSMLGAAAGYWLARGAWSEPAHRLLSRYEAKFRQLREGHPLLTVMRLQLLPIVPFGIFNYAAGVAELPFVKFLGGTALGIIPGTVAAVYVGDQLAAGFKGGGSRAFLIAALVMLALLAFSFAPTLLRKIRNR